MMRRSPGLRGNFQLAYGTPFWTSKGAPMGSLVRGGLQGLGCAAYDPVDGSCLDSTDSGSGINWATVANVGSALTKDFTQIYSTIQPVPQGCVKQIGPNGQSYISCGQPYASLGLPSLTSGSGWLMPVLLVGGGLLLFASLRGRG